MQKPGRKSIEDQKIKSTSYFEIIFAGILGGDRVKQRKIDFVSCKIFLLVYLETTRGSQNILMRAS